MDKPTDNEIVETLRAHGWCMTYVVASLLRRKFHPLPTAFILRRLKSLEKAGKVERVPTDYAVQFCWRATTPMEEA